MKELWLKFKDEYGEPQRVRVVGENFVIGRSPDNDLSIARNQLSRTHAEINRFSSSFVISDCNSSNGTTLNGIELMNPAELKNGDRVNLGGEIEIEVELIATGGGAPGFDEDEDFSSPQLSNAPGDGDSGDMPGAPSISGDAAAAAAPAVSAAAAPPSSSSSAAAGVKPQGSIFKSFFIIAPILVVVFLLFIGLLVLLFGGGGRKTKPTITDENDYVYTGDRNSGNKRRSSNDDDPDADETPTPKSNSSPSAGATPSNSGSNSLIDPFPTPSTTSSPVVSSSSGGSSELDVLERNAMPFMRRIAAGEDNYAFTRKQLGEINNHLKSVKSSSALKNNLKTVKRNAAKFDELAKTKGLKPQFLATAALARNPNQDPLVTAQTMLPILGELRISLNNERADENLLIIAAYNFGEQEKYRALQTTLEALAHQSQGVPPTKIRTIWYLREKGKITDEQYNFALRFLAIGALMQNPRDFNVDAEAVTF